MKSSFFALLALPALAAAQAIINTPPAIVQCQPVAIQFSGGTAPYFISVLPGGQQSAAALKTFPTQNSAGSYTWTADIAAGTTITFQIRDGSGNLNYSDMVTIQSSPDSSCVNGDASVPAGSSSSSSSAASSSSSAASSSAASTTSASSSVSTGSTTLATTTTLPNGSTSTGSTTVATTAVSSGLPPASGGTGAAEGRVEAGLGMMVVAALAMVVVA